jgi:L-fuculose-phosphate aldolase
LDGNLSARLTGDLVVCTRSGCHKGLLADDDLLVVDLEGRVIRGRGNPTSELAMHLGAYRARPDVQAVVHAHPPLCIAFTVAGESLARCALPEVVLTLGTVPTLPYRTTGTPQLAELVANALTDHDAVLMDQHGAVTVGATLLEAFCRLETMEHLAKVLATARSLGGVRDLPPKEAVALRKMGLHRYGGAPGALARIDDPHADLPFACTECSGCGHPSPAGIAPKAGFTLARIQR